MGGAQRRVGGALPVRRRATRIVLSAAAAAALTLAVGAPSVPAASLVLKPKKTFTIVKAKLENRTGAGFCNELGTLFHHSHEPDPGEVLVGVDNEFERPGGGYCDRQRSEVYRGYVLFDLRRFTRAAGRGFTSAKLRFKIGPEGEREEGGTAYGRGPWSAARYLGVLTSKWYATGEDGNHAQRQGFHPMRRTHVLPTGRGSLKGTNVVIEDNRVTISVTKRLQEWRCGVRPNYGFVLAEQDKLVPQTESDDTYFSYYESFRLVVTGYGSRQAKRC